MSNETKINIETFKAVTKAIAHSDNLDIMSNHLAQLLVAILNIKGCAIFVLNPETEELEVLASFGLSAEYLTKGPLSAPRSMSETYERRSVVILDILKDKGLQYPEEAAKEGIKAILGVPIVFLNEVLGSLRLYHYDIWEVSEPDLDSINLLAENIGLAMTYTRLLNAVQTVSEVVRYALPPQVLSELEKD